MQPWNLEIEMRLFSAAPKGAARMAASLECNFGRAILPLLPNCLTSRVPLPVFI